MNDRTTPEDDLFEFAANPANPGTGLEHTVQQVQHALIVGAQAMPDSIRQQIREDLMPSATVSNPGFASTPYATVPNAPAAAIQRGTPPRSRFADTIARWQPVVSMTIVVALLASVIALTYQRGVLKAPEESPTQGAFLASTPNIITGCTPNGELRHTSEEIAQMSMDDWPAPEYRPVSLADSATGQAVLDTYIGYYTCQNAYLFGSEERQIGDPLSDEMLSYQSDRYRFVMAPNTWRTVRYEVVPPNTLERASEEILQVFPLPINRPTATYWFPGTSVGIGVFPAGDVYELTDGRYGAIVGTVSIKTLRNRPHGIPEQEKNLTFVAFVEVDEQFYIDEYVPICLGKKGFVTLEGTPVPTPVPDDLRDSVFTACL